MFGRVRLCLTKEIEIQQHALPTTLYVLMHKDPRGYAK